MHGGGVTAETARRQERTACERFSRCGQVIAAALGARPDGLGICRREHQSGDIASHLNDLVPQCAIASFGQAIALDPGQPAEQDTGDGTARGEGKILDPPRFFPWEGTKFPGIRVDSNNFQA